MSWPEALVASVERSAEAYEYGRRMDLLSGIWHGATVVVVFVTLFTVGGLLINKAMNLDCK